MTVLCRWSVLVLLVALSACSQPRPDESAVAESEGEAPYFVPEAPPQYGFEDGTRLATLNAEFLFDGIGDEGQATFPHKGDPEAARVHRDRIGEVIVWLDADIIVLEEVENENVLRLLLEESLAGEGYEPYFVQGDDRFTGQDVGILSRVPIDEVGRTDERAPVGTSSDTYGVSKNIYARLTLAGVPTTLIGVHFLARPDDPERTDRREAQAEVIRQLVETEQAAGRAVAVLGDFNDFDEATLDRNDSVPITDVLQRIKEAGPGPEDDLRNVMADVPQSERFTAFYDRNRNGIVEPGELSALDHILLSPELYRRLREVTYVQAHDPAIYTDHFPVVVGLAGE